MKREILLSVLALAGCATQLTPEASKLRIVSAQAKESCERVKLITANQRSGTDKPGNAMKSAMNEAAAAGANAIYIVSTTESLFDGASVIAEALRCKP